jgi:hypothetical protein
MFAVDHAATALLIKRRFPSVSLTPLLLSVQAMELAWVGLNYLGIERTTTESSVRSVADIHLAYMPFSHSVATAAGAAMLAWLVIEKGFGRPLLARAMGIGIFSHLILDLVTHARDLAGQHTSGTRRRPVRSRANVGLRSRDGVWRGLLARLPRKARAAHDDCSRQPREHHAVLGGNPWARAVPSWASTHGRHGGVRTDRRDAGTDRCPRYTNGS